MKQKKPSVTKQIIGGTKNAREMFKASGIAKMTNTRVIKYGKIVEDIAYEIVETNSYVELQI